MARPNPHNRYRQANRRVGAPVRQSDPQAPRAVSMDRYAAPGDEPMAVDVPLTLQQPFRIEGALVKRLERREINPKEAFTIRDGTGGYVRASLKELDAEGGWALPYERMERSPEPTVDITLACSVLAR